MFGQVQTENGQKKVVPLSNVSTIDNVIDNDMHAVTSNAVYDGLYKKYKLGTTSTTSYIKIKILPQTSWMLNFTIILYQGYRATKIMVSGYNYGTNYWHNPEAVLLGDSDGVETMSVYFGYDSTWNLWVGLAGGNYTGIAITDIANGYTQVDLSNLFDISFVSSLGGTTQTTVTAQTRANYAISAGSAGSADNAGTVDGYNADLSSENNLIRVTKGSDVGSGANGYYAGMASLNVDGASKWWHILSMDWSGNDASNWQSQFLLPTQQGGVPKYRRNNSGGTAIGSSTWHSFITDENNETMPGLYTLNGGQQGPNYVGKNKVRFNMMNTTILGDATYKDWLLMDCYNGFDVGGAVALGISRQQLRAYVMQSNAGTSPNRPTTWATSGELPIITAKSWGTASGYVKFSNGLIIQWINDLTISSTTRTGTLPLAFSSASSYSIVCSVTARTGHRIVTDSGQTFSYQSDSSSSYHMKVFAIGY
jgi:hypothetical protein